VETGELAVAVRNHRLSHGPDALPESELRAIFSAEAGRVADATILCELLAPPLAARLSLPAGIAPAPATRSSPASPRPAVVATGSPAIADLLDAMLAAQRDARRPLTAAESRF